MQDPLRPSSRNAIINAGFALLSENPSASLNEIAQRAGVGRATLHRQFSGRDDLIRCLALQALKDMDAAVERALASATRYTEAVRLTLQTLVPLGARYGFLLSEAASDPAIEAEYDRQAEAMCELISQAIAEGGLDGSIPAGWYVRSFDALLIAAWESVNDQELTPDQATELAWKTFTLNAEATA